MSLNRYNFPSFIKKTSELFFIFANLGITEKIPENISHKVRLVNGFCVMAMILLFIFAMIDFLRMSYFEVIWDLASIFPFAIPLLLNRFYDVGYGRVSFVLVCNLVVIMTMFTLGSLDVFMNFLPIALATTCAIFEWPSEKNKMMFTYLFTLAATLAGSMLPKNGYLIDLRDEPAIKYFVIGFCSIAMTWLITYFNKNMSLYLDAVASHFVKRVEEQKALAQVGKFAAIGQLAGGIAHEINNPLAIIKGRAQMILTQKQKGTLDEVFIQKQVEAIIQTTQRISQITLGMLSLSRSDSAEKSSFDTKQAVAETVSICQDSFSQKGIKIINEVSDDKQEFMAYGSIGHFQQALMNLVSNSRDAILEHGGPSERWIKISAKVTTEELAVEVSDNGPGIPTTISDRIMDPFFTTKEVGKGTGLGLSLSKTLMEAQGGKLILVSLKNPTTFRLSLPRSKSLNAEPQLATA